MLTSIFNGIRDKAMIALKERDAYEFVVNPTVSERNLQDKLAELAYQTTRELFDQDPEAKYDFESVGNRLFYILHMSRFYMPDIARRLRGQPSATQEEYFSLIFGDPKSGFPNGYDLGSFYAELNSIPTSVYKDQLLELTDKYTIDDKGLGVVITDRATSTLAKSERFLFWNAARVYAHQIVRGLRGNITLEFFGSPNGIPELSFRPLVEAAKVRAGYIVVKDLLWSKLAS